MDMKLEVVVIPVSDVDRAKEFYKRLGWREDIDAAREELRSRGVEVSVFHDAGGGLGGGFDARPGARAPGPDPQRRSYASYASFSDPDGNVWLLQEITERLPGRV
jgi:catechol 2,3-dioxygenase-like lactoylglutathione lyase family enzyme